MIDAKKYSRGEYILRTFLLIEWGEDREKEIEDLSFEEVKQALEDRTPPEIRQMSYCEVRLAMKKRIDSALHPSRGGCKKKEDII